MGSEEHSLLGRQDQHKFVRSYNEIYTDLTGGSRIFITFLRKLRLIKSVYVTLT